GTGLGTTVMPWVAARGGKVDVVYYGTKQAQDDPAGVWNAYDSQRLGGIWSTGTVSNTPNRVGAVCTEGSACAGNVNRELLDLFEVAEDPLTNKAAVIYVERDQHIHNAGRHGAQTAGDRPRVRALI